MTRLCCVSHDVLCCQLLESAWSGGLGMEHSGESCVPSCWHVWQVPGLLCGSPSKAAARSTAPSQIAAMEENIANRDGNHTHTSQFSPLSADECNGDEAGKVMQLDGTFKAIDLPRPLDFDAWFARYGAIRSCFGFFSKRQIP